MKILFGKNIVERFKESEIYFLYTLFIYSIDERLPISEYPKIFNGVLIILYTKVYNTFSPSLFQDRYIPKSYTFKKNKDFGNLIDKGPQYIKYPDTIEALQKILKQADQAKTPTHFCGSAHSSNGLTLSEKGGIRLYLKKIQATFRMIEENTVEFRGTATLKQLAEFLNQHKKSLPVVGDQLHLTLGGYLSAGGVGYNSVEYGFLSDHVVKLELLLANGTILHCSEKENPTIFHAVLGGQGQLGVIIAAQIKVVEQKPLYLRMDYMEFKNFESIYKIFRKTVDQEFNYLLMSISYFDNEFTFSTLIGKTYHDENTKKVFQKSVDYIFW